MRDDGGMLIAAGGALGLLIAVYNFFGPTGFLSPLSDVAGTPGAGLMIFSTAALTIAGLVLAGRARHPALVFLLALGALAAILGTTLAGWLLDSRPLVAAMLLSGVGWAMRLFSPSPARA